MDLWIGPNYRRQVPRVLVLGVSWYGDVEPLVTFIPKWIRAEIADEFFTRLFNATSGITAAKATVEQREQWWSEIAFYNFVTGTIGPTSAARPRPSQFRTAAGVLPDVLRIARPHGVWIVGTTHSRYSAPVVVAAGIPCEIVRQPRSGITNAALGVSWSALNNRARQAAS